MFGSGQVKLQRMMLVLAINVVAVAVTFRRTLTL